MAGVISTVPDVSTILGHVRKIDSLAVDGLTGVEDSLAFKVEEIEEHLHGQERWFGKSGDQSGDNWATAASLTPYRAISGDDDFGGDTDDEAKVLGVDDTPAQTGMVSYAVHRIMVTAASNATDWLIRVIHGDGTMAAAEAAEHYTDVMVQEAKKGVPIAVTMHKTECAACQIWVRAKNATDNATIDFFVGIHEYEG